VHVAFIRAPQVVTVGANVEVTAKLHSGVIVGVRQQNVMGISFHPEVTGETRIHQLFVSMTK
jgi:5'-phosphate synthase pdxT subunit